MVFLDLQKTKLAKWLTSGWNFERSDDWKFFENIILETSSITYREDIPDELGLHEVGVETSEEDTLECAITYFSEYDNHPAPLVNLLNIILKNKYTDSRSWEYLLSQVTPDDFASEGIRVEKGIIQFMVKNQHSESDTGSGNGNDEDITGEVSSSNPIESQIEPNMERESQGITSQDSDCEISSDESTDYDDSIILETVEDGGLNWKVHMIFAIPISIIIIIMAYTIVSTEDWGLIVPFGAVIVPVCLFAWGIVLEKTKK